MLVAENSAAFAANILVEDMLVSIDGAPIVSGEGFDATLVRKAGAKVSISILRKEAPKTIDVQLGRQSGGQLIAPPRVAQPGRPRNIR